MSKITSTRKVQYILKTKYYNKIDLCKRLGITRPTLDYRLKRGRWKALEDEAIDQIYQLAKDHNWQNPQKKEVVIKIFGV